MSDDASEPLTSEEVKAIRLQLGMGPIRFAHILGVKPNTLQSWESGRSRVGADNAVKIRRLAADPATAYDHLIRRATEALHRTVLNAINAAIANNRPHDVRRYRFMQQHIEDLMLYEPAPTDEELNT